MWVCPTYDYAAVVNLGGGDYQKMKGQGVAAHFWFTKHIEAIKEIIGKRPFSESSVKPQQHVELLYSSNEIIEALELIGASERGYASFDYETNCLKPEVEGSKVLCASVCFGGYTKPIRTIAFPMLPDVIPAWCRFLQSGIAKISHNIKFEDRWSNVWFKTSVNNWYADTFLNAHVLDCRHGVCGLKFQATVLVGAGGYDDATKPYISGVGKINKMTEVPVEQLLMYNGLDSYFAWRLAVDQFRKLGIKPYWKENS
jgi:hypothetical protein